MTDIDYILQRLFQYIMLFLLCYIGEILYKVSLTDIAINNPDSYSVISSIIRVFFVEVTALLWKDGIVCKKDDE